MKTIFVAGHNGLVGSALCRRLAQRGAGRIVTRSHSALDLTDQRAVAAVFQRRSISIG